MLAGSSEKKRLARLTLDGSSTHWELQLGWSTFVFAEKGKSAKSFTSLLFQDKDGKCPAGWNAKGVRKQADTGACHRCDCHILEKKREKTQSERCESRQRQEGRRRGGGKGGSNALRFHHPHRCLEWRRPGTIRRDVTSGFPHSFCSTPCLNRAAGIWGHPAGEAGSCSHGPNLENKARAGHAGRSGVDPGPLKGLGGGQVPLWLRHGRGVAQIYGRASCSAAPSSPLLI